MTSFAYTRRPEPQFDATNPEQEALAIQFCIEIAGKRGEKASLPDPVRLLEMAAALYEAEYAPPTIVLAGERGEGGLAPGTEIG